MRIGQTSFVVFVSKLLASLLGFIATVYFARALGAEIYGYYASTIVAAAWLSIGGRLGVSNAISKRVSEGSDQSAFTTAGLTVIALFGAIITVLILLVGTHVDRYIGKEVTLFVVVFVVLKLGDAFVNAVLNGQRLVHISGALDPVRTGTRSVAQIALVFAGFGFIGMLVGYTVGYVIAILVGIAVVSIGIERPEVRHFRSLFDYAKFAWLSTFKTRTYRDVDILVLTAFVPASFVGIYAIAWSITKVLMLFGKSIRTTLFPEISHAEASGDNKRVETLATDALAYGGFIFIPALFGGVLLGDRLLRIYGPEFIQGTAVLGILIFASLLYGYQQQLMNVLNAVDRPDLSFRINIVFILLNLIANVTLVFAIGWTGAAIATALSVAVALLFAYIAVRRVITITVPFWEIGRQIFAASAMAAVVAVGRNTLEAAGPIQQNVVIVVLLVIIGALVYSLILLAISERFRDTVAANFPFEIPYL